MNPTTIEHGSIPESMQPGAYLALEREKRGISIDQIASKLNLRVQVLSYLEADLYEQLPEPVFVKGYIRAYCKYLGLKPDEVVEAYIAIKPQEVKVDKFLWQNQEHPHKNEKWLYWMTIAFITVSIVSVSMWAYENKAIHPSNSVLKSHSVSSKSMGIVNRESKTVKFSDLSKMRELLTSNKQSNFSPTVTE